MFTDFRMKKIWSDEIEMVTRIYQKVTNLAINVEYTAKDNISVNNNFHLTKRLRFLVHQSELIFSASLSMSDCLALLLEVASKYLT